MRLYPQSIKGKLLGLLLVFGLIPFIIVNLFTIRTIRHEIGSEILERLLLFVDSKTQEILSYFTLLENRTRDFATDGFIRAQAERLQAGPTPEISEKLGQYLSDQKKPVDSGLLQILILNPSGRVVASTNSKLLGSNHSKKDYFVSGKRGVFLRESLETELSDFQKGFLVATPLQDLPTSAGRLLGVLINVFDASQIAEHLRGRLGRDEEGRYLLNESEIEGLEVYLVDQNRNMMVHPQSFYERPGFHDPGIRVDTFPIQQCFDQGQPVGGRRYLNYVGREVVGVSVCFPERKWVVVSEMPTEGAFAPLMVIYVRFAFEIALLFLVILLAALVLTRRITEPLRAALATVRRVQAGDLDARIDYQSQDEIGQFSDAFNRMAKELKKLYQSLERKVREKTQKLHEKVIKIEQESAKYEAMLESIGDGLVMTDQYGKVVIFNSAAQEILDWERSRVIGKDMAAVLPLQNEEGAAIPKKEQPIYQTLSHLKKTSGIYYYVPNEFQGFPLAITVTPVVLGDAILGTIMVFRDVTKDKEVERMKTEFVSLVSHQLRTPLSGMKWFAEMLRMGEVGPLNAPQKEFLDNIHELNERMIVLVNDLLNISRIESGRIVVQPVLTDLRELVQEVLNVFHDKIGSKALKVTLNLSSTLSSVRVDPKLIREVYSNLLSNAIKYTPAGGEINISLSMRRGEILSEVSDNGYGIPKAEQRKVFQKFYRGSNIVSFETDGNGLGLYLAKGIVEASDGKMWFKSEVGKGSSFFFTLPRKGSKPKAGAGSFSS